MSEKTVSNITSALGSLMTEDERPLQKSAGVKPKKLKGLEVLQKRAAQAEANWYGLYKRKYRLAQQTAEKQQVAWQQGKTKQANQFTNAILKGLSRVGTKVDELGGWSGNLGQGLLGQNLMRNMDDITDYLKIKKIHGAGAAGGTLLKSIGAGNIAKNIALSPLGIGTGVAGAGMLGSNLLGQSQGVDEVAEAFGNKPWYKQLMTALSMVGSNPDDIRAKISEMA